MSVCSGERPQVIAGLGAIADRFDHVLLDQWGVLHAGGPVFAAARDCLRRLRETGKTIVILSNSGKRATANAERLAALGLPGATYDLILTSGEIAWRGLAERSHAPFDRYGRRCFLAVRGDDRSIVEGLDLDIVIEADGADFILLAGLDESRAKREAWRPVFTAAAKRGLPMLCANPDRVTFGPDGPLPGPGAMAALYESLGGAVHYVGKPHRSIYERCLARLGWPAAQRVLAIGDSIDHDVFGGHQAGLPTALVANGVHAPSLAGLTTSTALRAAVKRLADDTGALPHWVLPRLEW